MTRHTHTHTHTHTDINCIKINIYIYTLFLSLFSTDFFIGSHTKEENCTIREKEKRENLHFLLEEKPYLYRRSTTLGNSRFQSPLSSAGRAAAS